MVLLLGELAEHHLTATLTAELVEAELAALV
jgi:hypothetical protein